MARTLLLPLLFLMAMAGVECAQIDHVVVLMLENRAFDHMCGWLKRNNSNINGLTGNEFNEVNGKKYYVQDTCPYINPFDPDHSFKETTCEVMGKDCEWVDPAPMSGFAWQHHQDGHPDFYNVMHGFSPERVPAISTLAMEFALFDNYHASLPGPTVPNRQFFHSGQSDAHVTTDKAGIVGGFPQKMLIDVLNERNVTWNGFYQDISDLLYLKSARSLENIVKIQPWEQFLSAAKEGTLPQYTWLSPQFYPWGAEPAKDQHPDHDVVDGEKVIAEAYAALRNGPKWNNTLFMLTYDEHGGFYDHVSPPQGVPSPTGVNNPNTGFNFTREGVRVCTAIASPWIPRGTLVELPPGHEGKVFEHSSILNTLKNLFPDQLNNTEVELTNRTTWAPPFDHILSLAEPRTDCPATLPLPKAAGDTKRSAEVLAEQHSRAPNGLQKELYAMLEQAMGRAGDDDTRFTSQQEMGEYVRIANQKLHRQLATPRLGLTSEKGSS